MNCTGMSIGEGNQFAIKIESDFTISAFSRVYYTFFGAQLTLN